MPPDILALHLTNGTLFIGHADRLAAFASASQIGAGPYASRLRDVLARRAEGWRLRHAAQAWGLPSHGMLRRHEDDLPEQIARLVERGWLSARFLRLFRDERRVPDFAERGAGRLRVLQLGSGPPPAAPRPPTRPAPRPPLPPTIDRSPPQTPQKDFDDEDAQIAVLRAAAKDGTPFCEQCARAALRAAKAAA